MNPLVSAMLEKVAGQDTELRLLEEWFEHEVKCESPHRISECTIEVTHLFRDKCSGPGRSICEGAAQANLKRTNAGIRCVCGSPSAMCWTIIPI